MPASILFVHQGYELYGSDRTLIQSVQAAASRWPQAQITVLLPQQGDLSKNLLAIVDDVRIANLAILRKSNLRNLRWRDVGGFFRKVAEAHRMMSKYDLTYINTAVVMDYIVAASFARRPRLVHIHEIPTGLAVAFFSFILTLSGAFLVFNSRATQNSFVLPFWQRRAVVWNGVAGPSALFSPASHSTLNLLLIGRFNSWKGHEVLIRAAAHLPPELQARLNIRLVGSVFENQRHFTDRLEHLIEEKGLSNIVELLPFAHDPYLHYRWADVVVVPSINPEPFGLVAIEAMAAGRSVIAARHGGLPEIVVDGVTGSLVEPDSIESLAAAIASYIQNPSQAIAEGMAGRDRFAAEFVESRFKLRIVNLIADLAGTKQQIDSLSNTI